MSLAVLQIVTGQKAEEVEIWAKANLTDESVGWNLIWYPEVIWTPSTSLPLGPGEGLQCLQDWLQDEYWLHGSPAVRRIVTVSGPVLEALGEWWNAKSKHPMHHHLRTHFRAIQVLAINHSGIDIRAEFDEEGLLGPNWPIGFFCWT